MDLATELQHNKVAGFPQDKLSTQARECASQMEATIY